MPTPSDLKNFSFLGGIPEQRLADLLDLATPRDFAPGETIHEMGSPAELFFLLLDGKALLQVRMPPDIIVSLGSLKPGYCFGFSSLCPGERHDHTVVAARECRTLTVPGADVVRLAEARPDFGVPFLLGMYRLMNDRLTLRTSQFLTLLTRHPDLKPV